MPAAPASLTVGQLDTIYFNQLAQLAAESVGLTRDILGDRDAMLGALGNGNHFEYTDPETGQPREFGALRMTDTQAREFLDHYEILDVQSNTSSGFAGIALRDKDTGQITIAYRSTEPRPASYGGDAEHDILANGQMRDTGFAMAQTHDANQFLETVAGTYNSDPGSPPIKLVGFSLSGNMVQTQAAMYPHLVSQSETIDDGNMAFNATGRATVGNGTFADVMNTYSTVLANPSAASIEALPFEVGDPRRQHFIDLQEAAIRSANGTAENPADISPSGAYDDPAQRFAAEYASTVHQTSFALNPLPGQTGANPAVPSNVVSVTSQAMTGLYEFHEAGTDVLHAINQHGFDGDPDHAQGGESNPASSGSQTIDRGSPRLQSLGQDTADSVVVQTAVQGDTALAGAGVAGEGSQAGHSPLHIGTGDPGFRNTAFHKEGQSRFEVCLWAMPLACSR